MAGGITHGRPCDREQLLPDDRGRPRRATATRPDLHEFQITPQGTALITVYDAIECNLSSVGGPRDGAVADTLLQEIDLKTGPRRG